MQIRFRLTLQFIMIAAGLLLASFIYVHFQFKKNLQDEFYENLRSKAYIIAEMVAGKNTDALSFDKEIPMEYGQLSNAYPENISIYKLDGTRIYTFNPAPDNITPSTLSRISEFGEVKFENDHKEAIGVLYKNRSGESFIVVAESMLDTVHLDNLRNILTWVFFISIAMVALGGWMFARQALAPVSDIMNEVDTILPTDMSHRLETSNQRDELSRLVITFNKLLDRIQNVFRLQKMFLSNISHELKNPLNVITSQVEVTLDKERDKEEYKGTLSSILYDVKELNDVVDKLMQLARINFDGSTIQFQPHRIDEVIWQSKATLLKNHPEYKINFEVVNLPEKEEHLVVQANEQLLKTAIVNLMDNGCKFSPDKNVKVSLFFPEGEAATVEIMDKGPGIKDEELPMVFQAFYRSPNTSAVKGSGIGLSLVDSIIKLHQIDLKIISKLEGGTTFILKFPNASLNGHAIKV
jgi:signal transduction histidine kinase